MDACGIAPMPFQHPLGLKWNHSVVQEPDFVSEWMAQHNAFHLAWQLGNHDTTAQEKIKVSSHEPRPHQPKRGCVSFDSCISVSFGSLGADFAYHMHIHDSLDGLNPKPLNWLDTHYSYQMTRGHWNPHKRGSNLRDQHEQCKSVSLSRARRSAEPGSFEQLHCLPSVNEVSGLGSQVATFDQPVGPVVESHRIDPSFPHSFGQYQPHEPQPHDTNWSSINCVGGNGKNTDQDAVSQKPMQHSRLPVQQCPKKTVTKRSGPSQYAASVQQFARVSGINLPQAPRFKGSKRQNSSDQVPCLTCRLEHESPIDEFTASLPEQPPNDAANNPNPNQPIIPAFVDDLSTRLARMGYDIFNPDFDIPVRTWYLDHATIRRWTAPRILQLVGPPRGWEQQFSSLWVDQINPDEWFDVTVVYPDPPRSTRQAYVIMDLIVTQSLQLDRFPGLITVIPDASDAFDLFAVAASFDPFVSGYDIAQAADAEALCRFQECTVTFGWQEIPFTLRRHHVMAHGDGFQLQIRPLAPRLPSSSSGSQAGSSTDSALSRITSNESAPSRPRTMPAVGHADINDPRFTTPLHLFQMEGHEVVMQLLNAQSAQPTHEMANALRVPLNCLEALHIMPIAPDGFPELAIPAIVQRVGDIDRYSTDRLILIDTIYHHHRSPEGPTNQPTVVRTVQRVTSTVTRQQILFKAAVFHYCQHLQEGCAVSLNGYLWPVNHADPRPVSHGSYATVDVPPIFEEQPPPPHGHADH